MYKILVVEDEINILNLFTRYLRNLGYIVHQATNGEEALEVLNETKIELMVTDAVMPKIDGYQLVEIVRARKVSMPILMITVKDTILDKKKGFGRGVDDYMVKPIELEELGCRVKALLKRVRLASENQIVIGDTIIDHNTYTIGNKIEKVQLSKKEFEIMYKLLSNPDIIYTRQQLMDELWSYNKDSTDRTIDVHIRRIRKKIEPFDNIRVETIHGLGYKGAILNG